MMRFISLFLEICMYFSISQANASPIYLSGNYVTPVNMDSDSDSDYSDDEGIYDLTPDEDELLLDDSDEEDEDEDLDSEEDELDDLGDRIQEITYSLLPSSSNGSEEEAAPKGKKRPLETDEAPQLV